MNSSTGKYTAFIESFRKYWENESRKTTFIQLESEAFLSRLREEIPGYSSDCAQYQADIQAAATEYIASNGVVGDPYRYAGCLADDLRNTIDRKDWIRLQILYRAFWLNTPSDISDSLSYCIDKLVQHQVLEVKLSPGKLIHWNRGSTIEWFVEMIECYNNPIAVASLEQVCALHESDDIGAVRKALWALCGIKTSEAFRAIIHCMRTHPDEWIREQAAEASLCFKRRMLP